MPILLNAVRVGSARRVTRAASTSAATRGEDHCLRSSTRKSDLLESLEQEPPPWLVDSIGAPPKDDGSQRVENWRRLALTAHDIRRRIDRAQRQRRLR
jgi:hypothetical protein